MINYRSLCACACACACTCACTELHTHVICIVQCTFILSRPLSCRLAPCRRSFWQTTGWSPSRDTAMERAERMAFLMKPPVNSKRRDRSFCGRWWWQHDNCNTTLSYLHVQYRSGIHCTSVAKLHIIIKKKICFESLSEEWTSYYTTSLMCMLLTHSCFDYKNK